MMAWNELQKPIQWLPRESHLGLMGKLDKGVFKGPGLGVTISFQASFQLLLSYDLWTNKVMVLNPITSNTFYNKYCSYSFSYTEVEFIDNIIYQYIAVI